MDLASLGGPWELMAYRIQLWREGRGDAPTRGDLIALMRTHGVPPEFGAMVADVLEQRRSRGRPPRYRTKQDRWARDLWICVRIRYHQAQHRLAGKRVPLFHERGPSIFGEVVAELADKGERFSVATLKGIWKAQLRDAPPCVRRMLPSLEDAKRIVADEVADEGTSMGSGAAPVYQRG